MAHASNITVRLLDIQSQRQDKSDRELLEEIHAMVTELSDVVRRARENPIVRKVTDG